MPKIRYYLRSRLHKVHQRYTLSKRRVLKMVVLHTKLQSQIRLLKIIDYYNQKYGPRDNSIIM